MNWSSQQELGTPMSMLEMETAGGRGCSLAVPALPGIGTLPHCCRAESEQPEWQILPECEKEIAEGTDFSAAVEMCLESSEHSVLEESSPWKRDFMTQAPKGPLRSCYEEVTG